MVPVVIVRELPAVGIDQVDELDIDRELVGVEPGRALEPVLGVPVDPRGRGAAANHEHSPPATPRPTSRACSGCSPGRRP